MNRPQSSPFLTNLAYSSILVFNLMPFLVPVPISFQLFANSLACIYLGSYQGINISHDSDKSNKNQQEKMSNKDAYLFPVYGSGVLFGLYVVYKFFDKNILNYILSAHFTFFGYLSLTQLMSRHLEKFVPSLQGQKFLETKLDLKIIKPWEITISKSDFICGFFALIPTIAYFMTRYWLLNNLFGVAFSIGGIESLVLPNFQVGFILLWGLFFYDIFWVYGTDVMLTVAKSVDAPIKLIFPINLHIETPAFSMLGLGDIVIPGVFIALCLKYDIDRSILAMRSRGIKEFSYDHVKTPYFFSSLIGYALGIILTFNAMVIFDHPQPALLFLVPCCCLSVLVCGYREGGKPQVIEVFKYDEDSIRNPTPAVAPETNKEK